LTHLLQVRSFKDSSVPGGVQIPVTSAKQFDYRVITIFNWEF
jgi:hypothetical protein